MAIFPLGIDDLIHVKGKLLPVASRWRDIGLVLGISDSILQTIETNKDVRVCLTNMLRLWLHQKYNVRKYGEPSWQSLKRAVKSPAGGDSPGLADKI